MTLASFLYVITAIFGLDAALQFFAACQEGKSAPHRFADIAFGNAVRHAGVCGSPLRGKGLDVTDLELARILLRQLHPYWVA